MKKDNKIMLNGKEKEGDKQIMAGGKRGKVLGVNVPHEIAEKVERDAEKSQRTVSNVIRIILENHYRSKALLGEGASEEISVEW